jgi:hypothetical protein
MSAQNPWELDENWEYNPENNASYGYNNSMSGFNPQQQQQSEYQQPAYQQQPQSTPSSTNNPVLPGWQPQQQTEQPFSWGASSGLSQLPGFTGATINGRTQIGANSWAPNSQLEYLNSTPDYVSTMDQFRNKLASDYGINNYTNKYQGKVAEFNPRTQQRLYEQAKAYLNGGGVNSISHLTDGATIGNNMLTSKMYKLLGITPTESQTVANRYNWYPNQ